ncbi:MAG TPA: diaminopimelate decarboxylase [Candidatus Limiplasma sp.]|nr:diaminopimelate decarboxylase [Candidatus Limiplasma sp.]HPS81968.1 diaminopimelate decarboxylase [Candidatus Limiplasma sp.]
MPNFSQNDSVFEAACAAYATPMHLYDERGIRATARRLNRAFAWSPDFREYFAVKALPNPAILRLLGEEGCGLDCSSWTELRLAEACGFAGEQIMFSANDVPPEEFALARKLDALINLDDLTHVEELRANGGIPETVCLRFNPGGHFRVGNAIMGDPGDAKYGMTRAQLSEALTALKAYGAKRFGLHAFLSSNTTDPSYYPALARLLFETGRDLVAETGLSFAFANLSGGIGVPYRPEEPEADIEAIGEGVRQAYEDVLTSAGITGVALKTELGRYMTAPHGWLVTHITHEKNIYKHYLGLDASACDLMRPAMYGAYHHITVVGREQLPHDELVDVTGSLCENNDKFAVDRYLPKAEIGDILVIHDTGAHGLSMGYNYNGKLRCKEVLYREDGGFTLIRRAETPKDYFATLDVDPVWKRLNEEL